MSWALDTAARTLFQEARGEPRVGQQAVAHVMWNRVRDGRWGPNLATVCLWKAQFSGWYVPTDPNFKAACVLADNDDRLLALRVILETAEHDFDPTAGSLFYYANSMKTPPNWAKTMTFKGQFGHQLFWTDRGVPLTS
jgi:spore germination cell wall hydrolase CwlJ-like protein